MKKRFVSAVFVMAVWATGFYAWGRHDGAAKGAMEIPAVHIQWKGEEASKEAQAKPEVVDYVAISNAACNVPQEKGTVARKY